MELDQKFENGNKKWLVLCLGNCCLCGALSGATPPPPPPGPFFGHPLPGPPPPGPPPNPGRLMPPPPPGRQESGPNIYELLAKCDSIVEQYKNSLPTYKPSKGKNGLSRLINRKKNGKKFKQAIADARKNAKSAVLGVFKATGKIDPKNFDSLLSMWYRIAKHEADFRWNALCQLIESVTGVSPNDPRKTLISKKSLQHLHKEFSSLENQESKKDFLKKLSLRKLLALWNDASDDEKLAIFPCCPELFQAVVFGYLIQTSQQVGNQLLGYLPVGERVLYYCLLDEDFQKASFHFLPLQIQKRLQDVFNITPATLLPDSEQIEL